MGGEHLPRDAVEVGGAGARHGGGGHRRQRLGDDQAGRSHDVELLGGLDLDPVVTGPATHPAQASLTSGASRAAARASLSTAIARAVISPTWPRASMLRSWPREV